MAKSKVTIEEEKNGELETKKVRKPTKNASKTTSKKATSKKALVSKDTVAEVKAKKKVVTTTK